MLRQFLCRNVSPNEYGPLCRFQWPLDAPSSATNNVYVNANHMDANNVVKSTKNSTFGIHVRALLLPLPRYTRKETIQNYAVKKIM
jgi:hypothetical protein